MPQFRIFYIIYSDKELVAKKWNNRTKLTMDKELKF